MSDLISRQEALDALGERPLVWDEWADEYSLGQRNQYDADKSAIEALPPAQPEITEEQVREYCRKRGLIVIDSALLSKYVNGCQDMISGMPSAQPERKSPCADCQEFDCYMCGAKMEVSE